MKKIILRELPADVKRVIRERAREQHVSRAEAVLGILDEAAIERMLQHDLALRDFWKRRDDEAADEELLPFDGWDEEEGAFF